jgi:chromosome segregation ATPase
MSVAVATIGIMEKRLTLRDVINSVNSVATILTERTDRLDHRFDTLEHRFDGLEHRFGLLEGRFDVFERRFNILQGRFDKMGTNIRILKDKVGRIEAMVYAIQKENEEFHIEMRGIHKTIDRFNERTTRLEIHAGFPVEAAGEE